MHKYIYINKWVKKAGKKRWKVDRKKGYETNVFYDMRDCKKKSIRIYYLLVNYCFPPTIDYLSQLYDKL